MKAAAARWTAAACLSLWLCACGALDRMPTPPDQPAAATGAQPQVYYAGEDGLPLFPQPTRSGSPLAHLPLNEKFLRSKVEHGFASVTVTRTGQTGWVENAKLIWKKMEPPAPTPAAPAVPVPPAKSASQATEASGDNQPGSKPDASIFDAN